jgi:hypothetical protein
LIFSTRHLNATLEKCNLVEKFNTFLRSDFDGSLESLNHLKIRPAPKFAPKALPMSQVLYISGTKSNHVSGLDLWFAGSFALHQVQTPESTAPIFPLSQRSWRSPQASPRFLCRPEAIYNSQHIDIKGLV